MPQRKALIGLVLAVLGIAAVPAVGYPALSEHSGGPSASASKAKGEAKGESTKKCKKGDIKKKGKCVKAPKTTTSGTTTGTTAATSTGTTGITNGVSEPATGTLLIRVLIGTTPAETQPLRVIRLGPNGEALSSVDTAIHSVPVVPATYLIEALNKLAGEPIGPEGSEDEKKVTVGAALKEVTLTIPG